MSEATAAAVTETAAPATPAAKAPVPGAITSNGFSPPEESTVSAFLAKARAEQAAKDAEAPAEAATEEETTAAEEAAEETTEDTETPEDEKKTDVNLPKVEDLKKLAADGEWEKLAKALGIDPAGQKLPSNRFAEFRKHQAKERAKLENQRQAIEKRAAEVDQRVSAVIAEYDGFAKAKKAWSEGDVVGAIEAAFGENFDELSEKAVKQKLSQDPEVLKLKRKLELKEKAEQEAQQRAAEEAKRQRQAQEEQKYLTELGNELKTSDDPIVAKLAEKPNFALQVYRAQLHIHKTEGAYLTSEEAAQRVIEVLRKDVEGLAPLFMPATGGASTANTAEAGTAPQNTAQAGKSPENQRKAPKGVPQARAKAVTTTEDRSTWTSEQLLEYHKKQLLRQQMETRLGVKV